MQLGLTRKALNLRDALILIGSFETAKSVVLLPLLTLLSQVLSE